MMGCLPIDNSKRWQIRWPVDYDVVSRLRLRENLISCFWFVSHILLNKMPNLWFITFIYPLVWRCAVLLYFN